MPEVLSPSLVVADTASNSSNDSPKSTKSKKLLKISPRLRKKSRSKDNAVKDMETGGSSDDHRLPNGLNDKEKQDLQQVFEMFDKNKDGKISCEELGVVLRTLGHRYSQTEVEEMIKNADKNDNGFVEYDEFLILMKRWSANAAQQATDADEDEKAREAFRIFDMDGNGYIDRHELRFIMSRLGEAPGEEDICEMFRMADLNHDGLIDYEEFTKLMACLTGEQTPPGAVGTASSSSSSTPTSSRSSSKGVKKK